MSMSLGVPGAGGRGQMPAVMVQARAKVLAACKAHKVFFLNSMNPKDIIDQLKDGVMLGPASPEAAEIGRKYTKRTMPW
jgi:hypothetical protein